MTWDRCLLDWQNSDQRTVDYHHSSPISEFSRLDVTAMNKHLSEKAIVYWGGGIQPVGYELLANVETPFRRGTWPCLCSFRRSGATSEQSIEELERRFWRLGDGARCSAIQVFRFDGISGRIACSARMRRPEGHSSRHWRESANSYLVLHISDAYKIGMANPANVSVSDIKRFSEQQ